VDGFLIGERSGVLLTDRALVEYKTVFRNGNSDIGESDLRIYPIRSPKHLGKPSVVSLIPGNFSELPER
jgi:hypothetical protein